MSQPIVVAEQLGKRYQIGRRAAAPRTWYAALAQPLRSRLGRLGVWRGRGRDDELIWALRDASFEVRPAGAMATSAHGRSLIAVRRIEDGRARAVKT